MEQISVRWYVEDVSAHSAETVFAGLSGVGHVGKLVVDHLIRTLPAVKVAEITSTLFPPQTYPDGNAVLRLPRNEIFYLPESDGAGPFLLLAGDCQSVTPEGHYTLAEAYLQIFDLLGVKRICTLGGYGIGRMVEKPRVLAALSTAALRTKAEEAGAVVSPEEPAGGIIGAAGLLIALGRLHRMEGIALLGETPGYLVDPAGAAAVLEVLEKLTGIAADKTELTSLAEEMMTEVAHAVSSVRNSISDDLRYIG
jgi:uncharacterized protein (TIGR00162 family)